MRFQSFYQCHCNLIFLSTFSFCKGSDVSEVNEEDWKDPHLMAQLNAIEGKATLPSASSGAVSSGSGSDVAALSAKIQEMKRQCVRLNKSGDKKGAKQLLIQSKVRHAKIIT